MSLRARRREAAVDHLLASAARVFATTGYHTASMEQIAREADCAAATLYGYFKSKADLFSTLWSRRYEAYLDGLAHVLEAPGPLPSVLERWTAYLGEHVAQDPDFLAIMLTHSRAAGGIDLPQPDHIAEFNARYFGLVEALVSASIERSELALRPPRTVALHLIGALHSSLFGWLIEGGADDLEPRLADAVDMFLHGAGVRS